MRRKLRVLAWRYRYVIAAGLLALALVSLAEQVRPPPPGPPVLVASRDLPAGVPLTREDLTATPLPLETAGLAAEAVGRVPVIAVPAGLPIAESMLLGPGLADHAPPGTVVAPVHVADPAVLSLLRVGDRVELYAPGEYGQGAELVTSGVWVLAVDAPAGESLLGGPARQATFLGAIPRRDASIFTGASGTAAFRAVVLPARD